MSVETLVRSTYFRIDYRSLPSGIGHINCGDGKVILVTEADCGPRDMEEARKSIHEDYLPDAVLNIPFSMGEHWSAGQEALKAILITHDVKYVIDSELSFEYPDLVDDKEYYMFSLQNWFKARGISYDI